MENISAGRSISLLTGEILHHKSPVIRTTVSRLLALVTDRYVCRYQGTPSLSPEFNPHHRQGRVTVQQHYPQTFSPRTRHVDDPRVKVQQHCPQRSNPRHRQVDVRRAQVQEHCLRAPSPRHRQLDVRRVLVQKHCVRAPRPRHRQADVSRLLTPIGRDTCTTALCMSRIQPSSSYSTTTTFLL